jgi:hypothetical protein
LSSSILSVHIVVVVVARVDRRRWVSLSSSILSVLIVVVVVMGRVDYSLLACRMNEDVDVIVEADPTRTKVGSALMDDHDQGMIFALCLPLVLPWNLFIIMILSAGLSISGTALLCGLYCFSALYTFSRAGQSCREQAKNRKKYLFS